MIQEVNDSQIDAGVALQTVDAEGNLVESRMPNAIVMRRIYDNQCENDTSAAVNRTKIRAARDGAPPFDTQLLANSNQKYRSNINDRTMKAALDARDSSMFRMFTDVGSLVNIDFLPGTFKDKITAKQVGTVMGAAYTYVFLNQPCMVEGLLRLIRDSNEAGVGFVVRTDNADWRYVGVQRSRVAFNETATVDPADMELFFLADTMTVQELFDIIENPKSEDRGWDIETLKAAIVDFFYNGDGDDRQFDRNFNTMWDELQNRILQNDSTVLAQKYNPFSVIHGWVTERTGKVSHYIIPYYPVAGHDDYLYSSFEEANGMGEVVRFLPYSFGAGPLRSVKGLGHELYALSIASNRRLNAVLDSADLSGSLIVRGNKGGGDNLTHMIVRAGPITWVDETLEPIQGTFAPSLQAPLAVRAVLTEILRYNTGIYRPWAEDTPAGRAEKTAEQVRVESSKEAKLEEDRLELCYLRMDAIHSENIKKILDKSSFVYMPEAGRKSAELFWKYCEAEGIPEEVIKECASGIVVKTTRSIGGGSSYAQLNNLVQGKGQTYASMDEAGKREIDREILTSLVGARNVDRFIPPVAQDRMIGSSGAIQTLENHDIEEGSECLVSADQEHYTHATILGAALQEYAQAFAGNPQQMGQESLVRMANMMQFGIPHFLRHLEYLKQDPMRRVQVQELENFIQQLIPIYQQASQILGEVMQAEQERLQQLEQENLKLKQQYSQENMKNEREMMKMQGELQLKQMETQSLIDMRNQKTSNAIEVNIQRAVAKLQQDNATFQQKLMQEQAKFYADMQKKQMEMTNAQQQTSD